MRKFLLGFIMMIFCFSVVAQENENCGIVFSTQSVFQKMVQHDGLFLWTNFSLLAEKMQKSKQTLTLPCALLKKLSFCQKKLIFAGT